MNDEAKPNTSEMQKPTGAPPRPVSGSVSISDVEVELIAKLRARDQAAFGALLDDMHGRLIRLAMAFVPSRAVAEEVVQETWVGVLDGIDSFEGRSSLRTWIYRILTNRAKTRGVRENRTVPISALADTDGPAVDESRFSSGGMWANPPGRWDTGPSPTPEEALSSAQTMAMIEKAIDSLPELQRAVITLRDIDQIDSQEVCNVLGISETNQRVLLHRARSKLRTLLEGQLQRK